MKSHEMLGYVSRTTGLDQGRAEKVTHAFLETLAQRLPNDEAKDLAAQLPEELQSPLGPTAPEVEKFSTDEFMTRFARSAELSNEQARDMARAVWQAIEEGVTQGELDDVRRVLPEDFLPVLK